MKKRLYLLPIIISLIIVTLVCNILSTKSDNDLFTNDRLKKVVDAYLKDKNEILGTIVKIDFEGEQSFETAAGYIDLSKKIPIKADNKFCIGSITKTFTAVLVLQLVEKGKVELNNPLIKYLPEEWSTILKDIKYGNEITVEQALSHRSGIGDVSDSQEFWKSLFLNPKHPVKPIDYLKIIKGKKDVKFKPGTNYDYANANYILLGGLIEHVSGSSFGESLRKNIFNKIELTDSFLLKEKLALHNELIAHGYSKIDNRIDDGSEVHLEWAQAAGGIISTTDDLLKFFNKLRSGALFENDDTYKKMISLVSNNESYGLGMEIINNPDIGKYYGHKGNLLNTRSIIAYIPEYKATIAICHIYTDFSMSHPTDLMKLIVKNIKGESTKEDVEFVGPDILTDTSNAVMNKNIPAKGTWEFDIRKEWSLDSIEYIPIDEYSCFQIDSDGMLYLLNYGLVKFAILSPAGKMLHSFGERGDGPNLEYPDEFFITQGRIHVLDIARSGDMIKSYDKQGNFIESYLMDRGISPRTFIDDERYLAVKSGDDVLSRPINELLELRSLKSGMLSVLARFPAEEKLILKVIVPKGRFILLQDEIEIFSRLIIHLDKEKKLFVGRSDRFLFKKIDLSGKEHLAFLITDRERKKLPQDFAERLAEKTEVPGGKMPDEMKTKFIKLFPRTQTHFTEIMTDKKGFIYIFTPDIDNNRKQNIDIFSSQGYFIYKATIELPEDVVKIKQMVIKENDLYTLVKNDKGNYKLIKYKIKLPH